MSRQTSLRGQQLRQTVQALADELAGRSPYSSARMTRSWQGDRLILTAPGHMNGVVDFRDGNPSTVTIRLDLTSSLAEMMRGSVARDLEALAQRIPAPGQAASSQPAPVSTGGGGGGGSGGGGVDLDAINQMITGITGTVGNIATGIMDRLAEEDGEDTSATNALETQERTWARVIEAPDPSFQKSVRPAWVVPVVGVVALVAVAGGVYLLVR